VKRRKIRKDASEADIWIWCHEHHEIKSATHEPVDFITVSRHLSDQHLEKIIHEGSGAVPGYCESYVLAAESELLERKLFGKKRKIQ
jgi:hypothetical protein